MAFIVPRAKKFQLAPAGSHRAVCCRFVDLGTHQTKYGASRWVRLDFELSDELMDDGRPLFISKTYYSPSMGEKNAWRKDADTWLNLTEAEREAFDLTTVVGKPALLTVVHESRGDETYAKVAGISALPKGMAKPEPANKIVVYLLEDHDQAVFDALPDKTRERIQVSQEWLRRQSQKNQGATKQNTHDFNDDLNF
jgi:hypothetical protein